MTFSRAVRRSHSLAAGQAECPRSIRLFEVVDIYPVVGRRLAIGSGSFEQFLDQLLLAGPGHSRNENVVTAVAHRQPKFQGTDDAILTMQAVERLQFVGCAEPKVGWVQYQFEVGGLQFPSVG